MIEATIHIPGFSTGEASRGDHPNSNIKCMPGGVYDNSVACPATPCNPCIFGRKAATGALAPIISLEYDPEPGDDDGPVHGNALSPDTRITRTKHYKFCPICDTKVSRPMTMSDARWETTRYCSKVCSALAAVKARHSKKG